MYGDKIRVRVLVGLAIIGCISNACASIPNFDYEDVKSRYKSATGANIGVSHNSQYGTKAYPRGMALAVLKDMFVDFGKRLRVPCIFTPDSGRAVKPGWGLRLDDQDLMFAAEVLDYHLELMANGNRVMTFKRYPRMVLPSLFSSKEKNAEVKEAGYKWELEVTGVSMEEAFATGIRNGLMLRLTVQEDASERKVAFPAFHALYDGSAKFVKGYVTTRDSSGMTPLCDVLPQGLQ